jgi:tRNA nucleotidyltransferase (CCA-adding enzyme)
VQENDPPVEYRFTLADMWSRRLFVALLRRYGIRPYRYHRQRYTTVMAKVPQRFVDETLWPEYTELNKVLCTYLEEMTQRVIRRGIHEDSSEAEVMQALPEA